MPDRLQVVATALLVADVGVNGSVARSPREVFSLTERDMLVVRVLVALGEPKVDNINVVLGTFSAPDQEVVGFDITVDNSLLVNFLDALDLQEG